MVRIKDRFPDKLSGRSPIDYKVMKIIFFIVRQIDDIFMDMWNGGSPIGNK